MTRQLTLAATDTFRSLHIRNFRLFFAGQLISQTGTWLTMVAQTLLVLRLTDSGIALGPADRLPVRPGAACSAPGPAPSPTGATSAGC